MRPASRLSPADGARRSSPCFPEQMGTAAGNGIPRAAFVRVVWWSRQGGPAQSARARCPGAEDAPNHEPGGGRPPLPRTGWGYAGRRTGKGLFRRRQRSRRQGLCGARPRRPPSVSFHRVWGASINLVPALADDRVWNDRYPEPCRHEIHDRRNLGGFLSQDRAKSRTLATCDDTVVETGPDCPGEKYKCRSTAQGPTGTLAADY
jgi:hypothetical protein